MYIYIQCTYIYIYTGESRYLKVNGTVAKFRVIRNKGLSLIGNSVR